MTRIWIALATATLLVVWPAWAQDPARDDPDAPLEQDVEKAPELDELDKLAEQLEKAKKKAQLPPFVFPRNQVAPFDVLPYAKPHHWSTLGLEVRANNNRYDGVFETGAEVGGRPQIPLLDMPRAVVYRRDAILPADQTVIRDMQVMLPNVPRRLLMELTRPGAIRPAASFDAVFQRLEPHQMLIPILSPEPSAYNTWSKRLATLPTGERADSNEIERKRYYRLVLPMDPSRPNLSPHPLTWTTISHVVWDGQQPETLTRGSYSQQQAMLDWLHWGGQLIIVATGPVVAALEESFLAPYLPARVTGEAEPLTTEHLQALAQRYPGPLAGDILLDFLEPSLAGTQRTGTPPRYVGASTIEPLSNQPFFAARLEPKDETGIVALPIAGPGTPLLAVERRVGRGRVLMLSVNPNDPTLTEWDGADTMIRRLLLRRPEETWSTAENRRGYVPLSGPALSWVRYAARDIGSGPAGNEDEPNNPTLPTEFALPREPVAAWIDTSCELPKRTRDTLERASGITIPGNAFVLRILVAYIVALVPVNWLISRFVFRRREVAWVIAPLLALGFAYGVERAAAVDLGFDIACDEIDVVEIQGAYPRAHVARFNSLYSSGRVEFNITDPANPTALVLPMRSYQSLRDEQVRTSVYESSGDPGLGGFLIQPRSLAMYRAESIVDVGGGVVLEGDLNTGRIVNGSGLDLLDAALVDVDAGRILPLGSIKAWPREPSSGDTGAHMVNLGGRSWAVAEGYVAESTAAKDDEWSDVAAYQALLRDYRWKHPSEAGELRLVAWCRGAMPGQQIAPKVDRHRGVRLVVAHVRFDVPPDNTAPYFSSAIAESARE